MVSIRNVFPVAYLSRTYMDVRSLLFGSKLRIAGTVVGSFIVVVGLLFAVGVFGIPSVTAIDNGFGAVNGSTTEVITELTVNNPNPVGIGLGSVTIDYTARMNDIEMATGTKKGLGIGPGSSTIELRTYLDNTKIPSWWVTHIRNGETTELTVETHIDSGFGLSTTRTPVRRPIETDILGTFNTTEDRDINANQPPVEDPVAVIRRQSANWGGVSNQTTEIDISFVVYNPKSYPLTITQLGYDITLNEITMGNGTTADEYTIPPNDTETVNATLEMQTQRFDEWWVAHLDDGQVSELRIDFEATVTAGDLGTVTMPLDPLTYERTIETNIFGGSGADTTEDSDDGPADTTTTDDSDTTTTSEGDTTTTTTTTSDGGILALGNPDQAFIQSPPRTGWYGTE